jgi:hypothetical protein
MIKALMAQRPSGQSVAFWARLLETQSAQNTEPDDKGGSHPQSAETDLTVLEYWEIDISQELGERKPWSRNPAGT